jgi:hypothetical protein
MILYILRYGQDVENYIEVYLRTPGLAKEDITKALLARGNARKRGGEKLLAKAREGISLVSLLAQIPILHYGTDFQAVLKLDPSNKDLQHHLRRKVVSSLHLGTMQLLK